MSTRDMPKTAVDARPLPASPPVNVRKRLQFRVALEIAAIGPRLTDSQFRILMTLAHWADEHGQCHPGIESIARRAGKSVRSVQRIFANLEQQRELEIEKEAGPNGCNRYRICCAGSGYEPRIPSAKRVTNLRPPLRPRLAPEVEQETLFKHGSINETMSHSSSESEQKSKERETRARVLSDLEKKNQRPEHYTIGFMTFTIPQWVDLGHRRPDRDRVIAHMNQCIGRGMLIEHPFRAALGWTVPPEQPLIPQTGARYGSGIEAKVAGNREALAEVLRRRTPKTGDGIHGQDHGRSAGVSHGSVPELSEVDSG